jgi:hypothetical protein
VTGDRRRRAGDDTGASLVMALGLMTFLGLMIGALLSYSSASIVSTGATDDGTARNYDIDGALQTAINQVRNSDFNNDEGRPGCPDLDVPASDGTAIRVTCAPGDGTGGSSERVATTASNTPEQAVLTLGTDAAEAGVAQSSGTAFRVQGKVFSGSTITTGTGSVESLDSAVVAGGACTGTVISRSIRGAPAPTVCSAGAASIPADPAFVRPTTGLTYRPLPTCDASSTVEFQPGYYDDAVGLSAMMSGTGPCAGKTFLFESAATTVGYYYFDFHNGEGGGLPDGPRVWTITDPNAEIVGGTPLGWAADASVPSVPGACVSPLSSTTNKGVEFVLGGDSRIRLTAGAMELCGQYSSSQPPVALYGTKTGSDTVTVSPTLATDGTGTNPTDGPDFAQPDRITATDGSAATAVVDASAQLGGVTASVIVDGYVPAVGAIPAGSTLTSAKLIVVHRENNTDQFGKLRVIHVSAAPTRAGAPPLSGLPQPTIYQDGAGTAFHTDTLDLQPSLAKEVHDFGFVGMRVRYDAGAAFLAKVTENLDSIRLTLSYKKPAVRGQTTAISDVDGVASTANCVGAHPGCPLLETDAGSKTVLSVQGTVYAPLAALDLRLANAPAVLARAGVVVRAMRVRVTADPSFHGPLVEIPTLSTGIQPLDVYFRAYVAGKVVATARVRFPVTPPLAPSDPAPPGHRNVTVISWTVRPP